MNIQADNYKIELTHNELWTLAFGFRSTLLNTVKTHWVNHQKSWKENEKPRLILLEEMFFALGRPDLSESIEKEADKIFSEYNKKRNS